MWPFKKKISKVDEEAEALCKRMDAVENFAPVGSFVEYLGVKMLVVNHHKLYPMFYSESYYMPGLKLEWMDSMQRLQRAFLRDCELPLCKVISTPEVKASAATVAQQAQP